MNGLLERVLGTSLDDYMEEYVEEGFQKDYDLICKIKRLLTEQEFLQLYNMINCYSDDLYKIVRHINDNEEGN